MRHMEHSEISAHEVRVFLALEKNEGDWLTNVQIAKLAKVAPRTARLHTNRLTKLGILDFAEVFPAHMFQLSKFAEKRNNAYWQRLKMAKNIFKWHKD